jgi:hypothetical protein
MKRHLSPIGLDPAIFAFISSVVLAEGHFAISPLLISGGEWVSPAGEALGRRAGLTPAKRTCGQSPQTTGNTSSTQVGWKLLDWGKAWRLRPLLDSASLSATMVAGGLRRQREPLSNTLKAR